MIMNTISDLETLNTISCSQFTDSENIKVIPFDALCAYVINNNLYASLRTHLESGLTYEEYKNSDSVSSFNLEDLDVIATLELYSPQNSSSVFLFPYSKKEFIINFLSNLTPTLSDFLYELMKSTGRLIQIGGGAGKAIVIKPSPMNESHLASIPVYNSPEQIIESIISSAQTLKEVLADKDYYLNIISEKDQIIEKLSQEIVSLNNKIYSVYQTTWR